MNLPETLAAPHDAASIVIARAMDTVPPQRSEHALTAVVALQVLGLFVLLPLGPRLHLTPAMPAFVTSAIAVLVFSLVRHQRWAAFSLIVAAAVEAGSIVLRVAHPGAATESLDFMASLLFTLASSALLSTVVFGPGRVSGHRVAGAIAIYLNVGFAFALAYRVTASLVPHAFGGAIGPGPGLLSYVYYSFATLTTSAYGDIVPVDAFARSIANLEAITGQLFPATLLARLVMLELDARRGAPAR